MLNTNNKYKKNVRNMLRFVSAMDEKEKIRETDMDILENFVRTNPSYLNE